MVLSVFAFVLGGFFHCCPPQLTSDTSIFINTGVPKPVHSPDTSKLGLFVSELSSHGATGWLLIYSLSL